MAAGIIRNFFVQTSSPGYFPMIFHQSPCTDDVEEQEIKETTKETEDEDEREVEDEDDVASEAHEEEDSLEEVFLQPAHYTVDVTRQLLTFADLISRDVQRYFGRCHSDQEGGDIYNDSVSVRTSGCLRYYDDLLRIVRADEQKDTGVTRGEEADVPGVAKGNSDLGPLAELFGPSQGRSQPMMKRHLPLSFWTEPMSCCSLENFSNTADVTQTTSDTPSQDNMHTDTPVHYDSLQQSNMHALDNTQPDFSDLLANWDPNPEHGHTLMESMHMQHGTS
ncbi:protein PERCC1 [Thalassophryne amazonica]|uniref:protein PERCC1 n=1 Tax=Thalassophryne amazonica TaxID=390379 RepID=UPI00147111C3|nr:protein PERCC1 [Thalassophryne amazonica]